MIVFHDQKIYMIKIMMTREGNEMDLWAGKWTICKFTNLQGYKF